MSTQETEMILQCMQFEYEILKNIDRNSDQYNKIAVYNKTNPRFAINANRFAIKVKRTMAKNIKLANIDIFCVNTTQYWSLPINTSIALMYASSRTVFTFVSALTIVFLVR